MTGSKAEAIGIVDEGWHTGLILPVPTLDTSLTDLCAWFPKTTRYLVLGWGNRPFYMSSHPGIDMAIAALFPSASVLLAQGLPESPGTAFLPGARIRWVCVSRSGVEHLDTYLADYLQKDARGRLAYLGKGPFPDSRFFASPGTYDAFHTCNTWTATALHIAGLPVDPQGVLFAGQVMSAIHRLSAHAQPTICQGAD